MAILRLLILLGIWMCRTTDRGGAEEWKLVSPGWGVFIFLMGYVLIVLFMALWARRLARLMGGTDLRRRLNRYNNAMETARLIVPGWLAVGVFGGLQWGITVDHLTSSLSRWPSSDVHVEVPMLLIGIGPALLTWMALWWAEFPADRALREQSMLIQLDNNLPVHAPPSFGRYFGNHLRMQLLFLLAPLLGILVVRDLLTVGLGLAHLDPEGNIGNMAMFPLAILMLALAPELLRRVVRTERLPDMPLRRRLDALCRRAGLKYRDILLWHTDSSMGNAMVMGLFPRVRYILMSDLLLETMTDQQIEAVFAHELGHIAHRHMWWLVAFVAIFGAFAIGPGDWILRKLESLESHVAAATALGAQHTPAAWIRVAGSLEGPLLLLVLAGMFRLLFGFYSRWLERQADVYGARMMQSSHAGAQDAAPAPAPAGALTYVGEQGAGLFSSALRKVAYVNHIPVNSRNWLHGSIETRIRYLHHLSGDPQRTNQFDRFMVRLFLGVLLALCTFGVWGFVATLSAPDADAPPAHSLPALDMQTVPAGMAPHAAQ